MGAESEGKRERGSNGRSQQRDEGKKGGGGSDKKKEVSKRKAEWKPNR